MRSFAISLLAVGCGAVTPIDGPAEECPAVVCPSSRPCPAEAEAGAPSEPVPPVRAPEVSHALSVYTWGFHGGPRPPWTFSAFTEETWGSPDSGGAVEVADVAVGDELRIFGHFLAETAEGEAGLRLAVELPGQSVVPVSGALVTLSPHAPDWTPLDLAGAWQALTEGSVRVVLQGRADAGARVYVQAYAEIVVIHTRQ